MRSFWTWDDHYTVDVVPEKYKINKYGFFLVSVRSCSTPTAMNSPQSF